MAQQFQMIFGPGGQADENRSEEESSPRFKICCAFSLLPLWVILHLTAGRSHLRGDFSASSFTPLAALLWGLPRGVGVDFTTQPF